MDAQIAYVVEPLATLLLRGNKSCRHSCRWCRYTAGGEKPKSGYKHSGLLALKNSEMQPATVENEA